MTTTYKNITEEILQNFEKEFDSLLITILVKFINYCKEQQISSHTQILTLALELLSIMKENTIPHAIKLHEEAFINLIKEKQFNE